MSIFILQNMVKLKTDITYEVGKMKTEIFLIRHGETVWNTKKLIQGQLDSPLTDNGIHQSNLLSHRIKKINPDIIYTSDLKRAIDTANIINQHINKDIIKISGVRERHWGVFQGADWPKVKKFFPTQYKYYKNDSKNYTIPNGESYNQVTKRTMDSLIDIIKNHRNQKIVVVTHGGVISPLIRNLLSIPYKTHKKFMISNTSITKLLYNEFGFSILSLGDIAHLED
jgi:broad specificity phosphatase PhoE